MNEQTGPHREAHVAGLADLPAVLPPTGEPTAIMPPVRWTLAAAPVRVISDRRRLAMIVMLMIAAISGAVTGEAAIVSRLQHRASQNRAFSQFRGDLAAGVAPIGQSDQKGKLLALGDPMAVLEIPAAGIREVVGEGTTSGVLADGPGHSRTTPFPGQAGTSVIMGRRAAFGGPFKKLSHLQEGDLIAVTTGQGRSEYQVTGVRRAGDPLPPAPGAGKGRLTLVTADGSAFAPSGVLYVDADLTTSVQPSPRRVSATVDPRERPLGTERSSMLSLLLWLQVLLVVGVATIWAWERWGRLQAWLVLVPVLALAGIEAADSFLRLLPNLT